MPVEIVGNQRGSEQSRVHTVLSRTGIQGLKTYFCGYVASQIYIDQCYISIKSIEHKTKTATVELSILEKDVPDVPSIIHLPAGYVANLIIKVSDDNFGLDKKTETNEVVKKETEQSR